MKRELPLAESVLMKKPSMRKYLPYMVHALKMSSKGFWYMWTGSKLIIFFYLINLLRISAGIAIFFLVIFFLVFNPFSDFLTRNNPYIISLRITEQPVKKNDWHSYFNRGLAWLNLGMFDNALDDLNIAIKLDREKAEIWAFKAACYYNKKEYDETIKAAEKAMKLEPNSIYPLRIKAKTLQKLEREEEADEIIAKIREISDLNCGKGERIVSE